MTASPSPSERHLGAIVAAVVLGGLLGALLSLMVGQPARRELFDTWQRSAPRPISSRNVAVVLIDPLSFDAVGPWPWPRYYVARLTEAIAAQQPKAIGFDIMFAEPDAHNPETFAALYPELDPRSAASVRALPPMDQILARVLGSAPVVLARLGVKSDGTDPSAMMVDPEVAGRPPRGTLSAPQVLASIPALDDVALGHAMINGPPDEDGVVRRVPLAVLAGGRAMPGIAAELARIALGAERMTWRHGTLAIAGLRLPGGDDGRLALRFGRFPAQATYSAAEVLGGTVAQTAFRGKVVLIGVGSEGSADIVPTPLDNEVVGVFVQAQAVDAIFSRGWLARPWWLVWGEWLVGAVLVLLVAAAGSTERRWPLAAAVALMVALPLASWLAFDRANHLFDPIRPLFIGLGAIFALEGVLYLRTRAERRRLAAELVNQRVASALQEGELQAARSIQLGMVPGGETLAALDPRIEVGALLKPARSVGGDFYDAIRVDDDHLLFLIGDVTGKGVPAALYMALSKALTKSVLTRESGGLAHTVETLNRELMRDADEAMGLTMLIVLLDCATGEASLVNAGHENPIVLHRDGRTESLALDGGPPFCVCDFPYPEERAQLAPGEALILITDGVTEAQNEGGELFGLDAARESFGRHADASAAELVARLTDKVRVFEGSTEPSDDLTIVAIRYLGAGST
jgi:serine phosphatase RsbU (regulator of sigma subunit)